MTPSTKERVSKIEFSPVSEEMESRRLTPLTDQEKAKWADLKVDLEVVYGRAKIPLRELARLAKGSLLPLDQFADEKVEIYANGKRIGFGEVVLADGHFGVQITAFEENVKK